MNLLASPVAPAALPRRDPSSPAAAAGVFFSRLRRLAAFALRNSHISNGGLRDDNPGLDFVGLSFPGADSPAGRIARPPSST